MNDQSAVGYLATVDGSKPRVRPFGFMFEENRRFYFCTHSDKDVYKQIIASPYIEYSKTTTDLVWNKISWTRISGAVQFDDDMKKKERIFTLHPELKMAFQTPDHPKFKVFYLEHGLAILDDFTQPRRSCEF
jgi:uncharacterized pyridoxamine 5'-phosphate oxidase family protein